MPSRFIVRRESDGQIVYDGFDRSIAHGYATGAIPVFIPHVQPANDDPKSNMGVGSALLIAAIFIGVAVGVTHGASSKSSDEPPHKWTK